MMISLEHLLFEVLFFLSQYSPVTVIGTAVFLVFLVAYLRTRWTECLVIFVSALGYAAIPLLPN